MGDAGVIMNKLVHIVSRLCVVIFKKSFLFKVLKDKLLDRRHHFFLLSKYGGIVCYGGRMGSLNHNETTRLPTFFGANELEPNAAVAFSKIAKASKLALSLDLGTTN